jgi:hypothetical protein
MLEVAMIVPRVRGRLVETGVIAALLVFDAALGVLQKSRAQAKLAALKSRLAMNISIQHNGRWSIVPIAVLVEQNQQTRHSPRPLRKQCLCSTQRCNLAAPRRLSIARQRVESKDGILRVRDVPGAGYVFTIDLPRHSMTSG